MIYHSINLITSWVKCYQEILLGTLKTGNGRTELICGSENASCEGVKEAGGSLREVVFEELTEIKLDAS